MLGLWLMVVRRLWEVVKMGLEVVVGGILGKLGSRRGMRGGVIGLVCVRRRRTRSRVTVWARVITLPLFRVHVSASI
jgi:hypothetical protein